MRLHRNLKNAYGIPLFRSNFMNDLSCNDKKLHIKDVIGMRTVRNISNDKNYKVKYLSQIDS